MSPKLRKRTKPDSISIAGGVKGIGNVVGNNSHSDVSMSTGATETPVKRSMVGKYTWGRLISFIVAFIGILASTMLFILLLDGVEAWLIIQIVLAALVSAMGISGFLKPELLVDLLGRLFGKKE
jgi:pheromone shutdown protein TraB